MWFALLLPKKLLLKLGMRTQV